MNIQLNQVGSREDYEYQYLVQAHANLYLLKYSNELLLRALDKMDENMVLKVEVSDEGNILPVENKTTISDRKKEIRDTIDVLEKRVEVIEEELHEKRGKEAQEKAQAQEQEVPAQEERGH